MTTATFDEQWQAVQALADDMPSIGELFLADEAAGQHRGEKFSRQAPFMLMDFAKQCLDERALTSLLSLAKQADLSNKIKDLMSGSRVNDSENRPALHTALRLPKGETLMVNGVDVVALVHDSLAKADSLATRLRTGVWRGFSGKAITDVVNVGVGGSDLGPLMAVRALAQYRSTDIDVHFVSNMDGTHMENLLRHLNPETTVFVLASKSFGTVDTFSNARTALDWLMRFTTKDVALRRHFIGLSANPAKMTAWGIHPDNQLEFWEWVGGRFSMWSVIGFTVMVAIGTENFTAMLEGAHQMDRHFADTPLENNVPVLLGLLAVWNATFLKISGHTVLPYDGRLKFLPSYLTQLEMESNGKSVKRDGKAVTYPTCPILWGEVGSNAQHAFYQLLHQGTQRVSCDFIACVRRYDKDGKALTHQQDLALSNCLAQSRVMAFGNKAVGDDDTNPFRQYRGNQPSTTILLDSLTPESLGALVALYEHKVYVASVLWGINPFDQWGVEMGKQMAEVVYDALHAAITPAFDASTDLLLETIKRAK
ncbi:glucose-6-phosphate isomerase [Moraxella caviae]|uniref:Glucose-6-phosphate isomerase n=1 Tax=Moraxella caviae TaxID=34060 RepID=A0A1S9ZX11_9GAMM|nr:glucose-6-phosphate isomerase [Moraxella caviae]OOR87990.1 glucose-6-phosphate isomerase [Moraxella caviae]STZ09711.1 Glucose-6-phosphate isomerase [Moraxella caviae]